MVGRCVMATEWVIGVAWLTGCGARRGDWVGPRGAGADPTLTGAHLGSHFVDGRLIRAPVGIPSRKVRCSKAGSQHSLGNGVSGLRPKRLPAANWEVPARQRGEGITAFAAELQVG